MSCKFFSERIYYIMYLSVRLSITYTNWNLAGYRIPGHCEPVRRLVWQSPSIFESRSSSSVGALIERPAEKVSVFVFLSAKRYHTT